MGLLVEVEQLEPLDYLVQLELLDYPLLLVHQVYLVQPEQVV
jgi:hypothetical protein